MRKAAAKAIGQVGLFPVTQMDGELLGAVTSDEDVFVTPRQHRNPRQHRLAWALAQKVADACDWLHDRDDAMDYLKVKARHVRYVHEPNGNVQIFPRSIAYASLPQATFTRIFNRMVFVICNEILPGVKEKDLRREIQEMVGK